MGEFTIRIDGYGKVAANAGEKLVVALKRGGSDVSHRCGGRARCTTCRVRIEDGDPPMGEIERACLEEDGVLGQFRLSCQIRVTSDLRLAVLMPAAAQGWDPGPDVEP